MDIEDLKESLAEILPPNFRLYTGSNGQLIVYTGLFKGNSGELVEFSEENESQDEEDDDDFDPDFEPYSEEYDE